MISFKNEEVTKEEYKEIALAEFKINYYRLGCMPRYVNDIPNVVNYRSHMYNTSAKILHKGQYKLYLSELDFLTDYAKYGSLVIYIGAAPGHHINILYDNFKHMNLCYHLYDSNYFDSNLHTKEGITIFNEYFTHDHCLKYNKEPDVLFISDIRNMNVMEDNSVVPEDMSKQMEWVINVDPRACMLKFRLPYDSDILVDYLDGEIRLQAYAPSSTNECRLVAERPYKLKKYDPRDNENRLFYLNKIIRHWYDYDKILESYIIKKFSKYIKNEF